MLRIGLLGVLVGCGRVPEVEPGQEVITADTGADGGCGESRLEGRLSRDLRLREGCVYWLAGRVDVGDPLAKDPEPVTLRIEAGVTILAGLDARLIVHRGARLEAQGTSDAPIIFTADRPKGERGPGDWGGLVLTGQAPINAGAVAVLPEQGVFGGDNPDDGSGILRFVRIEWAGASLNTGVRMPGLGLYGVGASTQVRGVQVHGAAGDGVALRGGTVFVSNLLVTGSQGRGVRYTEGWQGGGQFWVVQQAPTGSHGLDGRTADGKSTPRPASAPRVSQVSLIGRSSAPEVRGLTLRQGTQGRFANLVVVGFDGGDVALDGSTFTEAYDGTLVVEVARLGSVVPLVGPELLMVPPTWTDVAPTDFSKVVADLQDPVTPSFCVALPGAVPAVGPGFVDSAVVGGCDPDADWTAGWTTNELEGP
ncbi:MAG: hypothetical protein AAGA48_13270 [Myxococcota bacterium]